VGYRQVTTIVVVTALFAALLPGASFAAAVPAPPETVAEELNGLPALEPHAAGGAAGDASVQASGAGEGAVSEPVETPIPFSMVGFEVPATTVAGGPPVEFRVSADGEHWTGWTETALLDPGEDGPEAEEAAVAGAYGRFTEPVWVGDAAWLQTRGTKPGELVVHLIDSAGLSGSLTERASAALRGWLRPTEAVAAGGVNVIARREWGADESWRNGEPRYASSVRYAVVHHTATANTYARDEAPAVVRGIYRYHTQSLGWSDIGYNVLVDRYGNVYEGRHGGVTAGVIGAHAAGFNTGSVGVAVIGEFSTTAPPAAAQSAVADVIADQAARHGFDPAGQVTVTSGGSNLYPAGTEVRLPTVIGHRDVGRTACPGTAFYGRLGALRQVAAERAGDVQLAFCVPGGVTPLIHDSQRIRTSVAASKWYWTASRHAVLASSEDFPDALAGAALAARHDAPLFLTGRSTLHADVAAQLAALGVETVWLLGGNAALSPEVEQAVAALPSVTTVRRLGGSDRFETAALVTGVAGVPAGEVVIARGQAPDARQAWPDAISGASLAATPQRMPTLLVREDRIPDETLAALRAGGVHTVYALGGTGAVSDAVLTALRAEGLNVTRLGGANRYETSVQVARLARARFPVPSTPVFLAAGTDFGDALVAGAVAARRGGPVLLTGPCGTRFEQVAGAYLSAEGRHYGEAVFFNSGTLRVQSLN
jgi:putative cell wall-binding protein